MLQIAFVYRRIVGMESEAAVLERDDQLYRVSVLPCGEFQQCMIVPGRLREDLFERRHALMLA